MQTVRSSPDCSVYQAEGEGQREALSIHLRQEDVQVHKPPEFSLKKRLHFNEMLQLIAWVRVL